MAALIPKRHLEMSTSGVRIAAPSHADKAGLCPGEKFGEQPGAAFCSAVLVDWDLVLTAGHCAHVVPLDDLAVVFGYYYREPGGLALRATDVHDVLEVAAEQETETASRPHLDYAWLRLVTSVRPPRAPVGVRTDVGSVRRGTALTFIGTGGGVPFKTDQGGFVGDPGEPWRDYFLASTDTAAGASGGGAFDEDLVLLAVLEGGAADYVRTSEGCNRVVGREASLEPEERFSYARTALAGLCERSPMASSLCRSDCVDPCRAPPRPDGQEGGFACSIAGGEDPACAAWVSFALLLLVLRSRDRRQHPAVVADDRLGRFGPYMDWRD